MELDFSKIKTIDQLNFVKGMFGTGPYPQELLDIEHRLLNTDPETIYQHLSRVTNYSEEQKKCIEDTVDKLMNDDISNANEPGLLLGNIQCGKTRTFVGVMALAFDKGFDACIVLTKDENGLVQQTKTRMEYEFRDFLSDTDLRQSAVVAVHGIQNNSTFTSSQINDRKNIFVINKNVTRLTYMLKLIKGSEFSNKKILIIDDEADFVSRAFYTKNGETEVGKVAKLIDALSQMPKYCRYLQVTATPYSLFLQPDKTVEVANGKVEVFRPRFTTLVPIHSNYIGGKQYFHESENSLSMYSHLYHSISDECMDYLLFKNKHKKVLDNALDTDKFRDLRFALMSYFVASAIRRIQEREVNQRRYNTCFFMHVSIETKDHAYEHTMVNNILTRWKNQFCDNNDFGSFVNLFEDCYYDFCESNRLANEEKLVSLFMPSKEVVKTEVISYFREEKYTIQVVNSSTAKDENLLGKDGQLRLSNALNIFIGGFKLDRGITIDHMLGFFYGRRPQVGQADTVLQHHRMYGNRSKEDMTVTRLYTTYDLYQKMKWIDNMDHQLRNIFIKAQEHPEDSIPLVPIQYSPDMGIRPCGMSRLKISDLEVLDSFKRITTFGFQTGSKTAISDTIDCIRNFICNLDGYEGVKIPFLVKKEHACQILKDIRTTYIYDRYVDRNAGMDWHEEDMIAALEAYTPEDGKVWLYYVNERNMSRVRQNGNFVDAPEDGNTDTPIARKYASDRPFLMLFEQNGLASKGWRDTPFFWPNLRLPVNLKTCVYCK